MFKFINLKTKNCFLIYVITLSFLFFKTLGRRFSHHLQKGIVEYTSRKKSAPPRYLIYTTSFAYILHQFYGIRHPILVHQRPEVTTEAMVHHFRKVSSIRADYFLFDIIPYNLVS